MRAGEAAETVVLAISGLTLAALVFGIPLAWAVADVVEGAATDPGAWSLVWTPAAAKGLAQTAGVSTLIASLAAALGVPWGLACARGGATGRTAWVGVAVAALAPSWLAYSGWGTIRSVGTPLGEWLARADDTPFGPASVVAGRVVAIGGLAMWATPIAAAVVGAALTNAPRGPVEAAEMLVPSPVRRVLVWLGLRWKPIAAAWTLVALIVAGSAIPLHLAQVETHAIVLWREQSLLPINQWHRVWIGALPLAAAAVVGSTMLVRALGRVASTDRGMGETDRTRARGWGMPAAGLLVFGLALCAPIAMLALAVRDWSSLPVFFRVNGPGLAASAVVSLGTAAVALAIALVTAAATWRGGWWSRSAIGLVGATLATGLMPGVLIGVAVAGALSSPLARATGADALLDGLGGVVLAESARFGFVGAACGWWAAARDTSGLRAQRAIGGHYRLIGWWRFGMPRQIGLIAAGSLAAGVLALQEIEAAVIVQPPGPAGLSQRMLGWQHYNRDDELSIAVLVLVGAGSLAALIVWVLIGLAHARATRET